MTPRRTDASSTGVGVRTKWTVGVSLLLAAGSLAAFLYLPAQLRLHAGIALEQQARSVAEVTAFAAGLFFDDPAGVQAALDGAMRVEGVVYVVVEDTAGRVAAHHGLDRALSVGDRGVEEQASCAGCPSGGPAALDVYALVVPIRQGASLLGRLHLGASRAALRAQVAEARLRIGLLCFIVLLLGGAGAYGLSSVVTGPLERIAAVVRKVSDGDLSERAPVVSGDEVGRLAHAFNGMIDELERVQRELREMNESLEERVDERTSALREALERRDRAEESNRVLAAAVEQSAEVLMVMDEDGVVQYVNPAFERVRGERPAEVVGRNIVTELRRELGDGFMDGMLETVQAKGRWVGMIERVRADGTPYLQRTTVSVVRDEAGRVTGIVAVGHDVTREVELESRLRQSQKMEAVGQLAGGVAHDFNNLLTAIRGHAELLLTDALPDGVRAGLEQISEASERATSLTRQLLAFSRRQILRPEPLLLDRVLRDLAPILSGLTGKDTSLRVVCEAASPRVVVDRSQLEQMLIDLVLNARDAIEGAGEITLSVERVPRAEAPDDWDPDTGEPVIRLSVTDTGKGIPSEYIDQVFEPFFTTKDVGEGAGLGLSTVYGIMQQSGGAVTIASEPGAGTRLDLYFAEAPEPLPEEEESAVPSEPGLSVLVVDDEPLVRSLVRRYLERDGYEVVEAESGDRAWELLCENGRDFGLLLSDVRMPGMDGLTLARRASETFPPLSILLMSGYSAEIANQPGYGDFTVLAKPFGHDELLTAVEEVTSP